MSNLSSSVGNNLPSMYIPGTSHRCAGSIFVGGCDWMPQFVLHCGVYQRSSIVSVASLRSPASWRWSPWRTLGDSLLNYYKPALLALEKFCFAKCYAQGSYAQGSSGQLAWSSVIVFSLNLSVVQSRGITVKLLSSGCSLTWPCRMTNVNPKSVIACTFESVYMQRTYPACSP